MVDLSEFKVSSYPDGHKHVVSDKDLHGDTTLSASIKTFDDLFLIAQIKSIHPELDRLYIKYLLAGRCDRRFSPGEAMDLRIVCDFINGLNFETVSVLKPHSAQTLDLLWNSHESDVTKDLLALVDKDLADVDICYVSPDQGASRWIRDLRVGPIIQGSKTRDANGAVSGVEFIGHHTLSNGPYDSLEKNLTYDNFVIIDDLCDGGATFITIAKVIKARKPSAKVYLVVTHAIFSKGLQPFEGWIDGIYCTDSFKQVTEFTQPNFFLRQIAV